jgi:hypothetical protein
VTIQKETKKKFDFPWFSLIDAFFSFQSRVFVTKSGFFNSAPQGLKKIETEIAIETLEKGFWVKDVDSLREI